MGLWGKGEFLVMLAEEKGKEVSQLGLPEPRCLIFLSGRKYSQKRTFVTIFLCCLNLVKMLWKIIARPLVLERLSVRCGQAH